MNNLRTLLENAVRPVHVPGRFADEAHDECPICRHTMSYCKDTCHGALARAYLKTDPEVELRVTEGMLLEARTLMARMEMNMHEQGETILRLVRKFDEGALSAEQERARILTMLDQRAEKLLDEKLMSNPRCRRDEVLSCAFMIRKSVANEKMKEAEALLPKENT
jgi:hypothetical protein